MKIDRLLGILAALLRRDKVTAPFLAEKFEVSRRTISRDIETLCMAGIPIVTEQGRNGGISIAPGYTFSRQLFTEEELHAISFRHSGDRQRLSRPPPGSAGGKAFPLGKGLFALADRPRLPLSRQPDGKNFPVSPGHRQFLACHLPLLLGKRRVGPHG